IMHGTGDRTLGMMAAQLNAVTQWIKTRSMATAIRLEGNGLRSQAAGLSAAALNPALFSDLVINEGVSSLSYLLQKPVAYRDAPLLFCRDLYKDCDFDRLTAMAAPAGVTIGKTL